MKTSLRVKMVIGASLLTVIILVVTFIGRNDEIQRALPAGSKVVKIFRSGGGGNGDFIYALKVAMSSQSYLEFVSQRDLTDEVIDQFSVIGYIRSADDLPAKERGDWGEPVDHQFKYYKNFSRSFVRATYCDGYMYYYSRGW